MEYSAKAFKWFKFHEHPIQDYTEGQSKLFDITSEGHSYFPPDFIKNGAFDHAQYCKCLIEIAFSISNNELSLFLDYQCKQLNDPLRWLIQFDTLLQTNATPPIISRYLNILDLLAGLIDIKRNEYMTNGAKKRLIFKWPLSKKMSSRFNIPKIREEVEKIKNYNDKYVYLNRLKTSYLQDVEDNIDTKFIRDIDKEIKFIKMQEEMGIKLEEDDKTIMKIRFLGTPSQFAMKIYKNAESKSGVGEYLERETDSNLARMYCSIYCTADGKNFSEESIRSRLSKIRSGTMLAEKNNVYFDAHHQQ